MSDGDLPEVSVVNVEDSVPVQSERVGNGSQPERDDEMEA